MSNDLVSPSDLNGLPGFPFTEDEVDIAAAQVTEALGWHVAPRMTTTHEMRVLSYQNRLSLPTTELISVTSVTINGVLIDPTTYEVVRSRNYLIKHVGYWPVGFAVVVFKHGYDECPKDLLPFIAEAAAISRRDESVKPYRLSFDRYEGDLPWRYSLYRISGMA